eukprot:1157716-Pelagomonas_calceolata.AAC.10
MDFFGAVGTVEQAEQPNYLAEGQIPLFNGCLEALGTKSRLFYAMRHDANDNSVSFNSLQNIELLRRALLGERNRGVLKAVPPLLFALYINDIDRLTEGVEGALTGNDLSFTTNRTNQMQCKFDRLRGYAARKGLAVNVSKSEVVHFNSRAGSQLPTFRCRED